MPGSVSATLCSAVPCCPSCRRERLIGAEGRVRLVIIMTGVDHDCTRSFPNHWCSRPARHGLLTGIASARAQLASPPDNNDREVGKWKTWVLSSGSEFRVPPPPDETASRIELEQLRGMIASRDPATRDRILWWDAVAPSYRWNQIAREEAIKAGLNANLASRRLPCCTSPWPMPRSRPGTASTRTRGPGRQPGRDAADGRLGAVDPVLS